MDAHTQLQDQLVASIKAAVMTPEVAAELGVPVKGVWQLVDRPLTTQETPAVVVEIGAESDEYQDVETPPDRIVERTVQAIVIVTVNADLKSFKPVVRRLTERVRMALAGFRRWPLQLVDVRIAGLVPEDYPSADGRQAGHTLNVTVQFWSRENDPGTILSVRS